MFIWNRKTDILFPMNVSLRAMAMSTPMAMEMIVDRMDISRDTPNACVNLGLFRKSVYLSNPMKSSPLKTLYFTVSNSGRK